jgi:hypothetical protein
MKRPTGGRQDVSGRPSSLPQIGVGNVRGIRPGRLSARALVAPPLFAGRSTVGNVVKVTGLRPK